MFGAYRLFHIRGYELEMIGSDGLSLKRDREYFVAARTAEDALQFVRGLALRNNTKGGFELLSLNPFLPDIKGLEVVPYE